MPTFELSGPDGATYHLDAPDEGAALQAFQSFSGSAPKADPYKDAARKEFDDLKAKGVPGLDPGGSRLWLQGATLNSADDIMAGMATPIEMMRAGTMNPLEGYRRAKAWQDVLLDEARKNAGVAGTAAEIAGGVMTGSGLARAGVTTARMLPQGAGIIPRSLAAGADAAGMGGVAGAMEGNSLSERAGNAAQGAALGGALGVVTPASMAALRTVLSPVVNNARALIAPQNFANSQVARAIMESGRTPQQVAGEVSQAAAEGQPMFTLADALGNSGQRMLSTTARAPGPGRTAVVDFLEGRQATQGRRVANAIQEGFDTPQTADQAREAMTAARDTAADASYGAARANAGAVDLSPVIAEIDRTLGPGVNRIVNPGSGIANDSAESALQTIRNRLTDGRSVMTDFTSIQRIRGDLADMAQAARQAGRGNQARLLGRVLNQLDTSMEDASTGFRQANRDFSQASRDIEAIDTGRAAALRGRTEDTIPAFQSLNPRGQQAYRTGYADPLIEQAQGGAPGVNKARPLLNDAFAAESAAMAPNQPTMARRIGREGTMFETRNHALGGSRTADNLADQGALGMDPVLGVLGHLMTGNIPAASGAVLRAASNGVHGNTSAVREAVANLLLQRGNTVTPQQLQSTLDQVVQRLQAAQRLAQISGRGLAGGIAVAPAALKAGRN